VKIILRLFTLTTTLGFIQSHAKNLADFLNYENAYSHDFSNFAVTETILTIYCLSHRLKFVVLLCSMMKKFLQGNRDFSSLPF